MGLKHKKTVLKLEKLAEKSQPKEDVSDNNSLLSEESDSDLDDEFDVAQVSSDEENQSSSESESESEDDNESDDDSFPLRKKKKTTDTGNETFATAFNAIIGSKLKAYDRKDPILARNKRTLKKLESDKLEAKAKRLLAAEKKEGHDKQRIKSLLPSADEPQKVREVIEKERALKKVAQKGVVKLFNAVLATQVQTNQEVNLEKVGFAKKDELVNEISKAKFLDMVKAAGQA